VSRARRPGRPVPKGIADLDRLEAVFSALAHAQRRQILQVLQFRGGELSAGQIAERFACSWPTTSRHLRVLEDAGLVVVERRGRERVYRLDRDRLTETVRGWLHWFEPAR
jgi:DNA-binding transcriptional ArsR family regulator